MKQLNHAWDLLKRIGFVRISGSAEEKRTAEMLKEEIESLGIQAEIQPFEVSGHRSLTAVLKSEEKTYEVTGYGHCAATPKEGITAGFYYMQDLGPVDRKLAEGKIVLVNGFLGYDTYKAIVEAKAVGFITFAGDLRDSIEDTDLATRELRPKLQELGNLPGVHLRVHQAMDLVKENPKQITLIIEQEEFTAQSQNVVCEVKGTQDPKEVIVLTAHYDSVEFSTGVYDNGAGSVILMALLHHFVSNPPKRTLRFIWCGSEERGLLGSHAYVEQHKEALEQVKFVLNVDVAGPVLGQDRVMVMAEESLVSMVDYLAKEVGFSLKVEQNIYSSDAIPFADQGIPGINFTRFGISGTAYIHNRHDTLAFMSKESLEKTYEFILIFAERLINSVVFPVSKEIPEVIVKKVDEYLKKPKKTEKK